MISSGESSIIDIVMGQPAIYISLLVSLSILILAFGLWAIFKLRKRVASQSSVESVQTTEEKDVFMPSTSAKTQLTPVQTVKLETVPDKKASPSLKSSSQPNALAEPVVTQAVSIKENDEAEGNNDAIKVEAVATDESEAQNSYLSSIFEETAFVDPQVQAMIDELPEISIPDLLEKTNHIMSELKKRNSMRFPG